MFSHISAVTGQIFPARPIADVAHNAGAQAIVDRALSFGAIPVDVRELDAITSALPCTKVSLQREQVFSMFVENGFMPFGRPSVRRKRKQTTSVSWNTAVPHRFQHSRRLRTRRKAYSSLARERLKHRTHTQADGA
jgi:Aminotransferase class-V